MVRLEGPGDHLTWGVHRQYIGGEVVQPLTLSADAGQQVLGPCALSERALVVQHTSGGALECERERR